MRCDPSEGFERRDNVTGCVFSRLAPAALVRRYRKGAGAEARRPVRSCCSEPGERPGRGRWGEELEFWVCLKVETIGLCTGWKWGAVGMERNKLKMVLRFMI